MGRLKALAKRSKRLVIAATIGKDLRSRWAARRGAPPSTSGSTHANLPLADSLRYIDSVFADYLAYGGIGHAQIAGTRVLELGTGDNYGVALRFLACGAREVTCVDKFASRRDEDQQRRIYMALLDSLEPKQRAPLDGLVDERGALRDGDRLERIEGVAVEELEELMGPDRFDLIVSRAVLEHLYDVEAGLAAMDAVLSPGGLMLHKVDFRDHGMFTDGGMHPLTFLTVSGRIYRLMTQHSGRPNRRLTTYYQDELAALGYDARFLVTRLVGGEELIPHRDRKELDLAATARARELVGSIRPRLAPDYRALDDLELATAGIFLIATKPAELRPGRSGPPHELQPSAPRAL